MSTTKTLAFDPASFLAEGGSVKRSSNSRISRRSSRREILRIPFSISKRVELNSACSRRAAKRRPWLY